jgi:hypothetical protein
VEVTPSRVAADKALVIPQVVAGNLQVAPGDPTIAALAAAALTEIARIYDEADAYIRTLARPWEPSGHAQGPRDQQADIVEPHDAITDQIAVQVAA